MTLNEAIADARTLRDGLGVFIDANKGSDVGPDERLLDADALAAKCVFHASSCLLLAGGTPIRSTSPLVLDMPSINVLVRATLEASLVFNHLFAASTDPTTAELRYSAWLLADLIERQNVQASHPNTRQVQAAERQTIEELKVRLRANGEFQRLKQGQQKEVLQKGRWKPGWASVARVAGFSEMHATVVHGYLSSYAHSGSLSVLQLRFPKTPADREALLGGALELTCVGLAFMTRDYWSVFPRAAGVKSLHPQAAEKVQRWLLIGGGGPDGRDAATAGKNPRGS